jgi:hypothetical protein
MTPCGVWPATCISAALMKVYLSHSKPAGHSRLSLEATTFAKLIGFVVTGMLCILTAVFTTVVESGGFWRYFWLGACILLFFCAVSFIILATKDGLIIDHTGLSFEPHDTSSVAEQKAEIGEDHRVI